MFCIKCGNQLTDTQKFCPKCGTPVVKAGSSPDHAQRTSGAENGASGQRTESVNPAGNINIHVNSGNDGVPYNGYPPQKNGADGAAVASLVLGILGLVTSAVSVGFLFGVIGIILAAVSKNRNGSTGVATAGLVLSIIDVVIGGAAFACTACGIGAIGTGIGGILQSIQ